MLRLVSWILNSVYAALLCVAAPWLLWVAIRHGKYRAGWAEKLLGRAPWRRGSERCLWFHAVSVGEVNLLATVIDEWRRRHPDWQIVISTTTTAAHDVATRKYAEFTVFYAPLDFSWAVSAAINRIRPTLLVLAELELWPNLILAADHSGASVAVINGRLGAKSFQGYRRLGPARAAVLRKLRLIAAQDETSATRFRELGAPATRVSITGSLKFDGAQTDRQHPQVRSFRQLLKLPPSAAVWIVGSTQAPEEDAAIEIFRRLHDRHSDLYLLIVPRHPQRFDQVAELLAATDLVWKRRSAAVAVASDHCRVWLIDSVGELWAWWGIADIATVGGSFGERGGQNMIEPAAYGAAVSYGPHTWNFRDITSALEAADGAVAVDDFAALGDFVEHCLTNPAYAEQLGRRARRFVATQLGATTRTVDRLDTLVADAGGAQRQSAA